MPPSLRGRRNAEEGALLGGMHEPDLRRGQHGLYPLPERTACARWGPRRPPSQTRFFVLVRVDGPRSQPRDAADTGKHVIIYVPTIRITSDARWSLR